MEFRRIVGLPPYVFTIINQLKIDRRQEGIDVIDLGFGNPDLPSPDIVVEKLCEAAHNEKNHRYSTSKGIPNLRKAVAAMYERRFNVELDPDSEVCATIGAKEGLSHLMWVLVGPGDTAIVPTPSYPIHQYAPLFAGAQVQQVYLGNNNAEEFLQGVKKAFETTWPRPRAIIISFPHNPTTVAVDKEWMQELVSFANSNEVAIVHDFAYADTRFDGFAPPSILECEGAFDCCVELYSMTKGFSMAGWRVAFLVGSKEIVGALTKLKSYLDYGTFQPIQIASIVALNEASDYPNETSKVYESRRDALWEGLKRIGWDIPKPQGTMFAWAPIPEPYKDLGSIEFSKLLVNECHVASSPGVGFGPGGEGFVRFALIENEQRIAQAIRNMRENLHKLG